MGMEIEWLIMVIFIWQMWTITLERYCGGAKSFSLSIVKNYFLKLEFSLEKKMLIRKLLLIIDFCNFFIQFFLLIFKFFFFLYLI